MSKDRPFSKRALWLTSLLFSAVVVADSWFRWATYQYRTFDLAFYVHTFWLALRGESQSSILEVSLMGNHAEPICYLALPLFWIWKHPMLFVVLQAVLVATMPFTGYRIARQKNFGPQAAAWLGLATLLIPATGFMALHEFHPETLTAPLLMLMYEARLKPSVRHYWVWFLLTLACKENVALMLVAFCAVFSFLDRKRDIRWQVAYNLGPGIVAAGWVACYVFLLAPWLNGGRVDYGELYRHVGGFWGMLSAPGKAMGAAWNAATTGNLLWGLLLPFGFLPVLRPRWLLIGAPIFAQHLLSFRSSEWSIHFHYAAPLVPLMWIATVEAASLFTRREAVGGVVLIAAVICQLWIGPVHSVVQTVRNADSALERSQLRSEFLAAIPPDASVLAGSPYLSHLATRERLYSLHHILKGLRTLSRADYVQPPPVDVVLLDFDDPATFDRVAGYYHPAMKTVDGRVIPDSEALLERYLMQANWRPFSRNELTILVRGDSPAAKPVEGKGMQMDAMHRFVGAQLGPPLPGDSALVKLSFELEPGRTVLPWVSLLLRGSDGRDYMIVKGPIGLVQPAGHLVTEAWAIRRPPYIPPGTYDAYLRFYDPHGRIFPPERPRFRSYALGIGSIQFAP